MGVSKSTPSGRLSHKLNPTVAMHEDGATGEAGSAIDGIDAVLFLDVDGVLHGLQARHFRQQFAPANMALLKQVIEATGATIVLSTAWRIDSYARRIVGEKLKEH